MMDAKSASLILLRLALGALFASAGFSKLLHIEKFAFDVQSYQLLPSFLVGPFTLSLATLEATLGLALLLGLFTRTAALIVSALTTIFIFAICINLIRGNIVDCGCYGILGSDRISTTVLLRNLIIFFATLTLALVRFHPASLDVLLRRRSETNKPPPAGTQSL